MFSLTELLLSGDGPVAALECVGHVGDGLVGLFLHASGAAAAVASLSGRPQLGLMAATVADLNLHVAIDASRAAAAGGRRQIRSSTAAIQDFIDEVRPTDFNDWLTLVRTAQTVSRERIEDYVATATAVGPLVPDADQRRCQP